jgi:hypothetical protein
VLRRCLQTGWLVVLLTFVTVTAQADAFEKLIMPGPVIMGHAKVETQCNKCHTVMSSASRNPLCLDCHDKVAGDIKTQHGFHGLTKDLDKKECQACHIEHKGRQADIVKLDERMFSHQQTDFPLQGAHKNVSCLQCHVSGKKYRDAPGQCVTCHEKNPHDGKLGKECATCHSQSTWTVMKFDHDKTKFKLLGKHNEVACDSCHINNQYKNVPVDCFSCHSVDDVHRGKNGKECAKCHNNTAWKKLKFDHDKDTQFRLLGRHKQVTCVACHPKDPFKVKVEKTCISCHKADDNHRGQYGDQCQTCHGMEKWGKISFDHDRDTKYALTGKHEKASCSGCHKGSLKTKVAKECIACHKFDDVHKGSKEAKCEGCHTTSSWKSDIMFDHDLSKFPLIGLHATTSCDDCHATKHYKGTTKNCNDCHNKDDIHKLRLGPACEQCHNPNSWKLWKFDHNKQTRFKLDGAHKKIDCYTCHKSAAPKGIALGQSCGYCHRKDDPHNNQFGQMCDQCHDTETFSNIQMMR